METCCKIRSYGELLAPGSMSDLDILYKRREYLNTRIKDTRLDLLRLKNDFNRLQEKLRGRVKILHLESADRKAQLSDLPSFKIRSHSESRQSNFAGNVENVKHLENTNRLGKVASSQDFFGLGQDVSVSREMNSDLLGSNKLFESQKIAKALNTFGNAQMLKDGNKTQLQSFLGNFSFGKGQNLFSIHNFTF